MTVTLVTLLAWPTFAMMGEETKVPETFLKRKGDMPKVLELPVSGEFKSAQVEDVLSAICSRLRVSHSFARGPKAVVPTFTGHFRGVSLREALYELAQQCDLDMQLVVLPEHGHWFVGVRPRGTSLDVGSELEEPLAPQSPSK